MIAVRGAGLSAHERTVQKVGVVGVHEKVGASTVAGRLAELLPEDCELHERGRQPDFTDDVTELVGDMSSKSRQQRLVDSLLASGRLFVNVVNRHSGTSGSFVDLRYDTVRIPSLSAPTAQSAPEFRSLADEVMQLLADPGTAGRRAAAVLPAVYDSVEALSRESAGAIQVPNATGRRFRVFLAGPISNWWRPGEWGSPQHNEYLRWRGAVKAMLVKDHCIVYKPFDALQGEWDEECQAINDFAIGICDVMLVLTPDAIRDAGLAPGTDAEEETAAVLGTPVLRYPPGDDSVLARLAHAVSEMKSETGITV